LYGLNSVTLPAFYAAHDHCCDICGGTDSPTQWGHRLHIDHDHETGRLRGLLCHGCNTAIGLLGDDPERLRRAINYLNEELRGWDISLVKAERIPVLGYGAYTDARYQPPAD
jgi:hypothetical protein